MHSMCLVRPALLYLSVRVLKVFYEQINYYYYYYYCIKQFGFQSTRTCANQYGIGFHLRISHR